MPKANIEHRTEHHHPRPRPSKDEKIGDNNYEPRPSRRDESSKPRSHRR